MNLSRPILPVVALGAAVVLGALFTEAWNTGGNSTANVGDVATRMVSVSREFDYAGNDPMGEVRNAILADPKVCLNHDIAELEMKNGSGRLRFEVLIRCR